jgi:hypothetical protein
MQKKVKNYYQEHKEQMAEKSKKYRQENKEAIKTKNCNSLICSCGSTYIHMHKARHERSIKHRSYIETL